MSGSCCSLPRNRSQATAKRMNRIRERRDPGILRGSDCWAQTQRLLVDLVAGDGFSGAISQAQQLRDYEHEVGPDLQIDATHSELSQIGKVADSLLEQGSSTMASYGAGPREQLVEHSRNPQSLRRRETHRLW